MAMKNGLTTKDVLLSQGGSVAAPALSVAHEPPGLLHPTAREGPGMAAHQLSRLGI